MKIDSSTRLHRPKYRGVFRAGLIGMSIQSVVMSAAFAQAPTSPTAPPPAATQPGAASPSPGGRVGAGEVTIAGGNVASARERALTDAMKQAVDQALTAVVPDARAAQPKVVGQVLGRARSYVRRYRTLEEGERGRGLYGIRIDADIDEAALLRAFDKPTTAASAGGATSASPSYLLMTAGISELSVAATRAFTSAGARVQPAAPDVSDPTKAVAAAARAGIPTVAFVSGTATAEGKVRGPGSESVTCTINVRVLTAGSGQVVAEETETARSFADRIEKARVECVQRATAAAIPRVVPAASVRISPDVRTIVVDADVVEPGVVPALVKQIRGLGSVSAVEVRRIAPGRAELWVRSRLAGGALATAVSRDLGAPVVLEGLEVAGDLIRVKARLREVAAPTPPGVLPTSAVPPAAAGSTPDPAVGATTPR
jgi:hypothetical protein